ncbi:MAG TPA: IS66 family transposase [Terriglobales bacterium]|nr:IS66 family transposase [Terriglobales bacterium]
MPSPIPELNDDPAALKAIIARLQQERDEFYLRSLRFEAELLRLRKQVYGPRADRARTPADLAQILLEFAQEQERRPVNPDDLAPATGETAADGKQPRRISRHGRRKLADCAELPTRRHVHELAPEERACKVCGGERARIGEESTWQIEYVPAQLERIEHVQVKYACAHCEAQAEPAQVERAPKPEAPIDKGLAGPGLLAYIVTAKHHDFLPLYRIERIFERLGFEISRGTQSVWCGDVADRLEPLHALMIERVRSSPLVATDDTVMPMQARGKTKKARLWVYLGDREHPYNVFDFTLNRGRDGPARFLGDYAGTLLADAYGGYNGVVVSNQLRRAGCHAHARRRFVDAQAFAQTEAAECLGLYRALYAIEARGRALDAAARLDLRQRESAPLMATLRERMLAWKPTLLPKHPMAEAIGYVLNQWEPLNVFLADGAVPIDNNVSEREMKRVVLNRKNSLFVGNERGGHTMARLASFTSTCFRHGVDPQRYLTQLLVNLPSIPDSQLPDWLPDQWQRRNPDPAPQS